MMSAFSTKKSKWTLLAKPRRGEHSLWRRAGDSQGCVYIADCSGGNPDRTEDGPLCLVGDLILHKGTASAVVAHVRVIREDATWSGYTMLHADVALWLAEHEGFRVVYGADDLRTVGKLLAQAK